MRLSGTEGKLASEAALKRIKKELVDSYPEEDEAKRIQAPGIFDSVKESVFRRQILDRQERPDGRRSDQIRPISSEVGMLLEPMDRRFLREVRRRRLRR